MRSVHKVCVRVQGKEIKMEVFDTLSEEEENHRYVGVFEFEGVTYHVRGKFSTSCQVEAGRMISDDALHQAEKVEKAPEEFYKQRVFGYFPEPDYWPAEVEKGPEEESVA